MRKSKLLAGSVLAAACLPVVAWGQTILFSENFDLPGAGTRFTQHWSTADGGLVPDYQIDFNYDYAQFQYLLYPQGPQNPPTLQPIPPAPGGTTTRGLRISVNDTAPPFAEALHLIPIGVSPGTDFRIEFHMWMNYNGGALGGTGSTETMVVGLNTSAAGSGIIGPSPAAFNPQAVAGYAFTATGEGGSANDYRMFNRGDAPGHDDGPNFPKVNGTWPASSELRFDRTTNDLILAGGVAVNDTPGNHFNSYYDGVFPGDAIGGGTFETRGAPGKNWVPVVVEQRGNEINFHMNGKLISTLYTFAPAQGVPQFGYTDEFNSLAVPAIDNFILFDNVVITQLAPASQFNVTSGNISNPSNWTAGVPAGPTAKANFNGAPGPATVTVDAPFSVRSITFDSPNSYTVQGPNAITLVGEGNTLMSNAGAHTISAPVDATSHLSVYNAAGSTLTVTSLTTDPTKGFAKAGTGTLEVNRIRAKNLVSTGGVIKLLPGGGVSRVERLQLLNATSKLDVGTNAVIVDYILRTAPGNPAINTSPLAEIRAEILSAYNGGLWDGIGIYSNLAQSSANYAIGYLDNGVAGLTTYLGESVDASTIIFRGTRKGDANLDGLVTLVDFNRLAANFGSQDADWYDGDFANYDRIVNLQDFNALAANFGLSAAAGGPTPQDWAALASAVPEPSSLTLVAVGAFTLLRRKRGI